jgi:signal transduction histidine kinase
VDNKKMNISANIAFDPADDPEIRLEKMAIFLLAGACSLAGTAWTAMYWAVFGWGLTTILPLSFVIIVGSALLISHFTKNHYIVIYTQIICIMYITAFIQWSIGGVFDSGVVVLWAFLGPICALMFFSIRQSIVWLLLYLLNLVITVVFNDFFASHGQAVTGTMQLVFFLLNLGVASIVVFVFAGYYVNAAIREQKKAQNLLDANLQQEIILRQNEKLATLGKLSAGVAHELNNPASATQRGAEQLKKAIQKIEQARLGLAATGMSKQQIDTLTPHFERIHQRARQPLELDPITRNDQEYEIETWLEGRGIASASEIAPSLINIGYDCPQLSKLGDQFSEDIFPTIINLLRNLYTTWSLLEEIGQGSGRITEIVKALKSYAYLDQAPIQSVNIHEGLDDTLVMFRSKLKTGVSVRREYADNLPMIEAYGSELNQVWTNLIDNAVGAMDGHGEISLRTYQETDWIVVEIKDNGAGIPPGIQSKIFDPFFTTKPQGQGTGLGLNISHNIITHKHGGQISVTSKPGETCFQVKLPINFEGQQS